MYIHSDTLKQDSGNNMYEGNTSNDICFCFWNEDFSLVFKPYVLVPSNIFSFTSTHLV